MLTLRLTPIALYMLSQYAITIFERLSGNCVRLASTNCNWFSLLTICPSTWLKRHAQNIIAFRFTSINIIQKKY